MTKSLRQARNLAFLAFLFLLAGGGSHAETPNVSGPSGAGGEEPFAVDDLLSSIADTFESVLPSQDEKMTVGYDKNAPKAVVKESEAQPKPPEEPKTIQAKRLDQDQASTRQTPAGQAAPPAPYKIYPSPVLLEDRPAYRDPYESAKAEMAPLRATYAPQTSGWEDGASSEPLDSSKPPPLPENVRAALSGAAPVAAPPQTQAAAPRTSYRPGEVPPISALPKQFFPILPSGALPDAQPQLLPVASNFELEADHGAIRRAIIIIHDLQRNSAEGVATLMTLNGSGANDTLILAPQFPLSTDIERFAQHLPEAGRNIARWPVEAGWQMGGESLIPSARRGISSFMATDLLLMFLADRRRFPVLEQVIIAGHGMGGDFVQRYAAIGQAPDLAEQEGLVIRFLVANASTYLYLTNQRPAVSRPGFTPPDQSACPPFNSYPFGLNELVPYARRIGPSAIRLRYPERRITYLVGDRILSDNYIDHTCAADLQGKDRTARAQNFARYLAHSFGETAGRGQRFALVPKAGYDPVSLYGSSCGMETLFGNGACGQAEQ